MQIEIPEYQPTGDTQKLFPGDWHSKSLLGR